METNGQVTPAWEGSVNKIFWGVIIISFSGLFNIVGDFLSFIAGLIELLGNFLYFIPPLSKLAVLIDQNWAKGIMSAVIMIKGMIVVGYFLYLWGLSSFAKIQRLSMTSKWVYNVRGAGVMLIIGFVLDYIVAKMSIVPGVGFMLKIVVWIFFLICYYRLRNAFDGLMEASDLSSRSQRGARNLRYAAVCEIRLRWLPLQLAGIFLVLFFILGGYISNASSLQDGANYISFLSGLTGLVLVASGIFALCAMFCAFWWPILGWFKIKTGGYVVVPSSVVEESPVETQTDSTPETEQEKESEPITVLVPETVPESTLSQSNHASNASIDQHKHSKKKKLMLVVACIIGTILIVSGLIYFFLRQSPIKFETFETDESLESPYDGGIAGLSLSIDYPIGDGERQANIAKGIRQIMSESSVSQEVGMPETNSIKEICYSMIENFRKGVKNESIMAGGTSYDLIINYEYQNSKAVFFCVKDGIYGNGGSQETFQVVRISDGRLMKAEELYNIPYDEAEKLLKRYAPKDDDTDFSFMTKAYLSRDSLGGKIVMFCIPHFYNSYPIPLEELAPFLTEEGRNLFDINSEMPAAKPRTIDEQEQQSTDVQATEYEIIDENEDESLNESVEAVKQTEPIMLDYSGKLGPIQVGQKYSDLPESYSGLYDKSYYHESSKTEDYKWGYSLFMKDGHEVFRLDIRNDIIEAISLSEYSSYIKTSDGFFVGYPARGLFV